MSRCTGHSIMRYIRSLNTRSLTRYLYNSEETAETLTHHTFVISLRARTRIETEEKEKLKPTLDILENIIIEMHG